MSKPLVLVTGAGGFIGSRLVQSLLAQGYKVRACDIPGADLSAAQAGGAQVAHAGLEDPAAVAESVRGTEAVIHTAAIFDLAVPRETILRVNIEGTKAYCAAAQREGAGRFVMFSTSGVYGVPRANPCGEATEKHPRNAYEESKWRSEQVAMEFHAKHGLPVAVLRPTLVYGPGSRYGQAMYLALFTLFRHWGYRRMMMPRSGPLTHHVHVEDVVSAAATLLAANGAVGKAFNVAEETAIDAETAMRLLCEQTGLELRTGPEGMNAITKPAMRFGPRFFGGWVDRLNSAMARTWPKLVAKHELAPVLKPRLDIGWFDYLWADHAYDTTALRSLGWKPQRKFLEGLPDTVRWYRENRWLPPKD